MAQKGEITGILGRNGSGKTSLLRIIFGSLKPKYKNVRINGVYQKGALFRKGKVAYLPQYQLLPKNMRISTAFSIYGVAWEVFVSDFPSFAPYKNVGAGKLSSGERRVVETYLTLFSGKEIILLDEPFSYIAPIYVAQFKTLLRERRSKCTVLVTDHFYRDILEISDSVYFLNQGYSKKVRSQEDLEREGYVLPR